jgi:hypothetical protein
MLNANESDERPPNSVSFLSLDRVTFHNMEEIGVVIRGDYHVEACLFRGERHPCIMSILRLSQRSEWLRIQLPAF